MASENDEYKISKELTGIFRRIKEDIPESAWAAVDDVWAGLEMVVAEINRAARGESTIKALYETAPKELMKKAEAAAFKRLNERLKAELGDDLEKEEEQSSMDTEIRMN